MNSKMGGRLFFMVMTILVAGNGQVTTDHANFEMGKFVAPMPRGCYDEPPS